MGGAEGSYGGMVVLPPTPTVAPLSSGGSVSEKHNWQHFDDSANAVSIGFVATAILISMFLVLAIFEKLLRQRRSAEIESNGGLEIDLEGQIVFDEKLHHHPSQEVLLPSLSFTH